MEMLKNPLVLDACSMLYPTQCCNQILIDLNLFEAECLKTVISKTLGYGIIAGSTIVKLPQVMKIVAARSGEGISAFGVILELLAVTFAAAYAIANKYPLSAWGESLFLMLETAAIAFFVMFYDKYQSKIRSFAFLLTYILCSYVLMSGFTPINVLWVLQATNLPLVVVGKMIQAFKNYQNGHTGQLSAITVWLLFLGAAARIFTSMRETGDNLVVWIYICATLANIVIVAQLMYYWNKTNIFLAKDQKKKTR